MKPGRRVAFDYGSVRIGVAISDVMGIIASPLTTLLTASPNLKDELIQIFSEYEPIYIALGEPKHLSGEQSSTRDGVDQFRSLLQTLSDSPIHLIDERMSSVFAAKKLRDVGIDSKSNRSKIDAAAAVVILESAMARESIAGQL